MVSREVGQNKRVPWGESLLLEVFPGLALGTAEHSKRRTSSGESGRGEGNMKSPKP